MGLSVVNCSLDFVRFQRFVFRFAWIISSCTFLIICLIFSGTVKDSTFYALLLVLTTEWD